MRRLASDRGAAAVEMAMVSVFLIALAIGVVELSHATYTRIGVEEAAQDAIIYASYNPDDPGGVKTRAMESSSRVSLSPSEVAVSCPAGSVRVTVTHQHDYLTDFLDPVLGPNVTFVSVLTSDILSSASCVPG